MNVYWMPMLSLFQVEDTTLRLAGGDLGDRAPSKPRALLRTLSSAFNMTVLTVIAGQVKRIRTTVNNRKLNRSLSRCRRPTPCSEP